MKASWPASRIMRVLAGPVMLAGLLAGLSPASASAASCQNWTGLQPPGPGATANVLEGVTVASACGAWAVGFYNNGDAQQPLIEHWNGSAWKAVPAPDTGGSSGALVSVRGLAPHHGGVCTDPDTGGRRGEETSCSRWPPRPAATSGRSGPFPVPTPRSRAGPGCPGTCPARPRTGP